jgi:hypothetical protein
VRPDWTLAVILLSIVGAASVLPTVLVLASSAAVGLSQAAIVHFRLPGLQDGKLRTAVGLALVIVWWLGLLLATPCYSPYPRLMLPWLLATWLGAAICWRGAWNAGDIKLSVGQLRAQVGGLFVLLVAAGAVWFSNGRYRNHIANPAERRGIEVIAREVRAMPTRDELRAIYVYGEPALYFQLRAAREENVAPVQDVPSQPAKLPDGTAVPTFLLVGPHSQTDRQFQQQWEEQRDRFELVKSFEYEPSAIVWLDLHDPRKGTAEASGHAVRMYRWKP